MRLSFKLSGLGSLTGILRNIYFIGSKYILERSRKCCSKNFSQKSMKLMVALSETNDYAVESDGNALPPPLIPS